MKIPELQTIVDVARFLLSASASIYLTWKGRARWEPSEVDVPRLPQKIVGLLSAVLLASIALDRRWTHDRDRFFISLAVLSILCVAAALLLLFMAGVNGYYTMKNGKRTKIVGGFVLTRTAGAELRKNRTKVTLQNYLLTRARSDPDRVWPRWSRSTMKVLFVACYVTVSVAGTGALSLAALAVADRYVPALKEGRISPKPVNPDKPDKPDKSGRDLPSPNEKGPAVPPTETEHPAESSDAAPALPGMTGPA